MSSYTLRYLTACAVLAAAAAGQRLLPSQPAASDWRPDWTNLPRRVGQWVDEDLAVDKQIVDYLEAELVLSRVYRNKSQAIRVSAIFGTQWRSLHSPVGCLTSQGWDVVKRLHTTIPAPPDCPHAGPLNAEVVHVKQGQKYAVVTYLYAYPGGTTANWIEQCYRVTRSGGKAGGIVFIVESDCAPEDAAAAQAAEAELIKGLYCEAVRGWYQGGRAAAGRKG